MKLIHKVLTKEANRNEKQSFYKSIESDADLKEEALDIQNLWHLSHIKESHLSVNEKKQLFEVFWKKTEKPIGKLTWLYGLKRYAAAVIIALIGGMGIQYLLLNKAVYTEETYVYQSEKGSVSTIILPDSSKVWMNSDSRLEITNKKGLITAKLTGEAYFDIKHDENREFIVDAGAFKIKDLGTKFNVKAYPQDRLFRATLLEGDIDILSKQDEDLTNIDPGQGIIFNKITGKYWVKNIDVSIESAWTEGKFVFVKKTLAQICEDLEKWYNVEFEIQNKEQANTRYTCVLKKTTTVEQVLKILKVTSEVDYTILSSEKGKDMVVIK